MKMCVAMVQAERRGGRAISLSTCTQYGNVSVQNGEDLLLGRRIEGPRLT